MGVEYSLRFPRAEELDSLLELHRASMGGYIEAAWGPWDDGLQRSFWNERVAKGLLQVIEVGGVVAGLLEVHRSEGAVEVVNLELAPEFQRAGIGSAILVDIQEEAAARGAGVVLQVLKVNPARRLYERLGFVATGETEWHTQMRWSGTSP